MKKEAKKAKREHFETGKYFHLHNKGSEGRIIFSSQEDYDRFEAYLYLLNSTESPRASNFFLDGRERNIFESGRGEKLIGIGAYSFTPKEFQLLATPLALGGVAKFMQKIQTAYTMYFNKKYVREGRLFHSKYKSNTAESDEHLNFLFAHVHLSPAILFNPEWDEARDFELVALARNALKYRYSSSGEYAKSSFKVTSPEHFPQSFLKARSAEVHLKFWNKYRKSLQKLSASSRATNN